MNTNSVMTFIIQKAFWTNNQFIFADLDQIISMKNNPIYSQITKLDDEFQLDNLPSWYNEDIYNWTNDGATLKQYFYK